MFFVCLFKNYQNLPSAVFRILARWTCVLLGAIDDGMREEMIWSDLDKQNKSDGVAYSCKIRVRGGATFQIFEWPRQFPNSRSVFSFLFT